MPTVKMTNFPGGFANGVTIRGVSILNLHPNNIYWVDSVHGSNGNKGTFSQPLATIDYAIGLCTASVGDIIMVKAGHAETLTAASTITCDVAGVAIIGMGSGANRPTLTFGTATTASVLISAANVAIENIVGIGNIDALSQPFDIRAANCWLDVEWRDASSTVEAARAVLTTAAAAKLTLKMKYYGQTGGDACVNAVRLVGVDGADIDIDFYGKASTSVIEFHTTACTNINVTGRMYVSGTTSGAKDVVDTVTGSTWSASIWDGAAGSSFSGGSGATFAADDISTVLDQLSGSTGVATYPSAAAAANGVSIAEVLRYVSENQVPRFASKVIAAAGSSLTTGASPVTLFTVTGDVVARVFATVQTGLTSTGGTGTLAIGVSGNTGSFIAATTMDGTNFPTGAVWAGDTSPTVKSEVFTGTALNWAPIAGSANITTTIATNSATAGAITFYCQYIPLSSGAAVVGA